MEWDIIDNHHLYKEFKFKDFKEALEFVNKVGEVAEEINHHPNISFTWGKVEIEIFTHDTNSITEKDYVLSHKIDEIKN